MPQLRHNAGSAGVSGGNGGIITEARNGADALPSGCISCVRDVLPPIGKAPWS
jgi:hypothetical protein